MILVSNLVRLLNSVLLFAEKLKKLRNGPQAFGDLIPFFPLHRGNNSGF